ncbi:MULTISPECIES: ABC transporter substrate-binding protein [Streptomyces]|uniref:ABC transporter substrate-binding protein n=1 Tax=Streptomyces TaxID=1883 RepID=UPI00200D365D|nr:ABC transporter substrate-binding protein [Streptomyces sp. LRE541]UPZ32292.1 ABC transporter substrate-binding protein [Streptomyces sp. LRE541]
MNRKPLVLPAAIGLLASVLAACGGSDSGGDGGDAIVVGTTDRFSASKETPAPFDPAYAYDVGAWNVLRQTVQTLMAMPNGGGDPTPEAAEECGFTDSGNERYTCTLRKDLKFSNGDPVTAEDVKFSIDRALQIKADTEVYALLSTVDTVETKGDREVIFHLKSADATFPFKLTTPVAGIVNPKDYAKNKLRNGLEVSGSGPYSLKAETKGDDVTKVVFTKNPYYQGISDIKNDKVELESFEDTDSMGAALDKGDIDMMTRTMSPEQIKKLQNAEDSKIDVIEQPGLEIRYIGFDVEKPSLKDKAVRQAIAHVVNRGELTSKVYGTGADPLYSMVPATVTGHANSFFNEYGEPDVTKAKNLLTAANITTPVKFTMNYTTDHYGSATKVEFETLQKQLNDTGLFDVDIKGEKWETYRPKQREGKFAVYGMGWFPDFPDAETFLTPFLDKNNTIASPYVNKRIRETLIPESRREADRLSASKSIEEIQKIVADDVPLLPLWQGKQYVAVRDDITGAEYALNSSATLQLWELGRGVGSDD